MWDEYEHYQYFTHEKKKNLQEWERYYDQGSQKVWGGSVLQFCQETLEMVLLTFHCKKLEEGCGYNSHIHLHGPEEEVCAAVGLVVGCPTVPASANTVALVWQFLPHSSWENFLKVEAKFPHTFSKGSPLLLVPLCFSLTLSPARPLGFILDTWDFPLVNMKHMFSF